MSHTGQKFSGDFFVNEYKPYFQLSLSLFTSKVFEQYFYQYVTAYLVRIWTYKNADETPHTFSWRSKNEKKRTKTDEKRILRKFP